MIKDVKGKRVVVYARVSTRRQADNDISVPDQIAQGERWVAEHGAILAETFVEPGASATTDSRPVFSRMMRLVRSAERPIDIILVHSLSRLFRNALDYLKYRSELKTYGVSLVSITQMFGDDPGSELALSMLALFDEYQSAENAKHVRRTMIANAASGFWNGHTPPIGFMAVSVPQPKGKDRKKLVIDPDTVHIPRLIFETYVNGTKNGPIGIAALAHWLNVRGERLRGKPFHTSNVQLILANTAYIGVAFFNKSDSRAKTARPTDEWVPIPVPPIISEELFYSAQAQRAERDPKMGKGASKTNSQLLTGKAKCGCGGDGCGASMTTSTGKSGNYRYYSCQKEINSGPTICEGRRFPMKRLDDLVTNALIEHVTRPARLTELLQAWLAQSSSAEAERRQELKRLRTRVTLLDSESSRVIKLVRNGLYSPDDPQIATELAQIAAQKKAIAADVDLIEHQLADPRRRITPEIVEKFGELLRQKLAGPKEPLRREYVRLLVDRVEVGHQQIRIIGSKVALARAASGVPPHIVPKAVREWRARLDSNQWPQD